MSNRTCFVISPIGSPDSEERIHADRFLEMVKEIAELHNLDAVRADEVSGTADINADVIERVQNSDLCIIDLSGLNPNVMYEFGMRYQTGLPYVICAKHGTELPFDIISRRTVFYGDLEKAKDLRAAKEKIRSFIKNFEISDYQSLYSISNTDIYNLLHTVAERVERIEKFGSQSILHSYSTPITTTSIDNGVDDLLSQLSPSEAFRYAYSTKQIKVAESIIDYCRNEPKSFFMNKLCALATLGSEKAAREITSLLNENESIDSFQEILELIGSLVTCYNIQNTETQHYETMNGFFEKALSRASSNRERAAILNQKQRLYAGGKSFESARNLAEEVIKLNDEEPAYFYNYATILRYLKDASAIDYAKKAVDLSGEEVEDDHLSLLCMLLKESDNPSDMELLNTYLQRLERISPLKARLIRIKLA